MFILLKWILKCDCRILGVFLWFTIPQLLAANNCFSALQCITDYLCTCLLSHEPAKMHAFHCMLHVHCKHKILCIHESLHVCMYAIVLLYLPIQQGLLEVLPSSSFLLTFLGFIYHKWLKCTGQVCPRSQITLSTESKSRRR